MDAMSFVAGLSGGLLVVLLLEVWRALRRRRAERRRTLPNGWVKREEPRHIEFVPSKSKSDKARMRRGRVYRRK